MQKYMLLAFVFFWILSHAEASCPKYNRKDYRHWIDSDRDCQNTRNEVLIQESLNLFPIKAAKVYLNHVDSSSTFLHFVPRIIPGE